MPRVHCLQRTGLRLLLTPYRRCKTDGGHKANSEFSGSLQCHFDGRQGQQEGQRHIQHRDCSLTGIPSSYLFVLGVDEKRHAADIDRDQQAASSRCEQEKPAGISFTALLLESAT